MLWSSIKIRHCDLCVIKIYRGAKQFIVFLAVRTRQSQPTFRNPRYSDVLCVFQDSAVDELYQCLYQAVVSLSSRRRFGTSGSANHDALQAGSPPPLRSVLITTFIFKYFAVNINIFQFSILFVAVSYSVQIS